MSKNQSAKNSQVLGMSYSTALYQLKKHILFKLVQKANEDMCFVCKTRIDTIDELSIEHKLAWLDRGKEFFWDLNNIAFSHLKCNKQENYRNGSVKRRITSPDENMAWCSNHKAFIPKILFDKGNRWDGLKTECKECRNNKYKQGINR